MFISKISYKSRGKWGKNFKSKPINVEHNKSSLNLKITDKTYNTELEKIIPKLCEFKFKSLEFDLGYTSKSVFQSIMEYLDGCGKDSLESFKTKVFSRHEFESLIEFFVNTNINLKSVKLILFTEVIVDLRGLINKFKVAKPFVDLVVEFAITKGSTFTVRDRMKELIKRKQV